VSPLNFWEPFCLLACRQQFGSTFGIGTDLDRDEDGGNVQMTPILKTRGERKAESKRLRAMPNGIDKLYSILTRTFISFEKRPIGTLMIEAILDHEYPERK
jgi:hypothetical protein